MPHPIASSSIADPLEQTESRPNTQPQPSELQKYQWETRAILSGNRPAECCPPLQDRRKRLVRPKPHSLAEKVEKNSRAELLPGHREAATGRVYGKQNGPRAGGLGGAIGETSR